MTTIFPSNPQINDIFDGYKWNGTAWKLVGISLADDYPEIVNGKISEDVIPTTIATKTYADNAANSVAGTSGIPYRMSAGTVAISVTQAPQNGWNWGNATVTFPAGRFSAAPKTVASANSPYGFNGPPAVYASGYGTTSFTAWCWGIGGQTWDLNWIAVQMTSGAGNG